MRIDGLKVVGLAIFVFGLGACMAPQSAGPSAEIEANRLEAHLRFLADEPVRALALIERGGHRVDLPLYLQQFFTAGLFPERIACLDIE